MTKCIMKKAEYMAYVAPKKSKNKLVTNGPSIRRIHGPMDRRADPHIELIRRYWNWNWLKKKIKKTKE